MGLLRTKLSAGDELFIRLEESTSSAHILPVSMPLSICYEDEDILAVNKPAQMPVHPSLNHYDHTLANAVCGYYNDQEIPYTFRCVNRLDRDTTGLTLIAKHMLSSAILSTAATRREISREYIAIASGKTPESGTIDAPIGRVAGSTIERQIDFENGERAITHYRRLAYRLTDCPIIAAFRDRTYPSDPCSPKINWTSADRGFSLQSDGHNNKAAGTSLLPLNVFASHHRRIFCSHCSSSR